MCLALDLPGLRALPPVDRDEVWYAQATRQMVQSGDFLHPRFQGADRFEKPIGVYWLQSLFVRMGGPQAQAEIWRYRLPSVLGALVAVLLTYIFGCRLFDSRTAVLAAALLASSALLVVEAHLATTDAALLACVVAAQGCLGVLYVTGITGKRTVPLAVGFWVAQAAGVLIKGPVVPALSAMTVFSLALLDRFQPASLGSWVPPHWGHALGWKGGLPLAGILVAPWIIATVLTGGAAYYEEMILVHILPTLVSAHWSHGGPPGYHALFSAIGFWPASWTIPLALLIAWRRRGVPAERFCIAWWLPFWLIFEFIPTKLPHYVLPTYPALALLAARAVLKMELQRWPVRFAAALRIGMSMWLALSIVLAGIVLALSVHLSSGPMSAGLVAFTGTTLLAFGAAASLRKQRVIRSAWLSVFAPLVLFPPLLQLIVPRLEPLWPSRAAAREIARRFGTHRPPLAAAGYLEPSLVFLLGSDVLLADPEQTVRFVAENRGALLLATDDVRAPIEGAAARRGVPLHELWSVPAINYSKGHWIRLALLGTANGSGPPGVPTKTDE